MRSAILAFAAGVLFLQQQSALPASTLVAVCAIAGAGGLVTVRHGIGGSGRGRQLILIVACAFLGFSWAAWRADIRLADSLPTNWEMKDIRVSGVVASLPQRFGRGERFVFDVDSVETAGARVPSRLILSWYRPDSKGETITPRAKLGGDGESKVPVDEWSESAVEAGGDRTVHPGERWRFTVRLKRPHGTANPHGFDYEAWLLERGIGATGTVRPREEATRLEGFVWRPGYAVERLREVIRQRFLDELPEAPYVGVLVALAVGDQRTIPGEQWQIFSRTGVTHLVSISGLHVTMVAALCAALVNALWRRGERLMLWCPAQRAAVFAGWLAALAYALIAGFEVPAQRTLYMLSVVALALWSGRNLGAARTLLLALLAVLIGDPWAVLSMGFWLSFGAVAVLFFVGTSRLGGDGPAPRWSHALRRWGAAQWAVTVGSIPLLLLFFQQFSLVSPLANAVAIPVISFVVTPLALIYAVLPWPPLLHLDHWLLAWLMKLLEALAAWPVWQQPAPDLWSTLLAVAGVAWLLLPRGFPSRWLGLCLVLPALTLPPPRPVDGTAWLDVLDVGQGSAVLVRTASHALLYDTGPRYGAGADAGQRIVVPFLRANGVARLDALVVSHRDQDHAGGLDAVRAHGPVLRFLSSFGEAGGSEDCIAGQSWEWDGVRFTVLHPEADAYARREKRTNGMSCVLRVVTAGGAALLTGDIEAIDERALVARMGKELRSDILVVPHHGGRGSSSAAFVEAVAPRVAIFSAGYRNGFGHPHPDILQRYTEAERWRTDRDGLVHVELDAKAPPVVSAWRQVQRRYWQSP